MAAAVLLSAIEVNNRLEQLGWSANELFEVVDAMVSARNSCTDNDPTSAAGWMAWKEGTRRLRELGRPKGLEKFDADQIPWLLDRERGVRFAVSNTDDGTGLSAPRQPQNRNKKGPATDRAVATNQGSFMDALVFGETVIPLSKAAPQPGITVSWYLCVYSEGDEIRAELSCPSAVEAGFFADFIERIILIGPKGIGDPASRNTDYDPPQFEINITRKKN